MEISTSLLSVNKENSTETFYRIEAAHTDYFHIDVMDGEFVENDTTELMQEYIDTLKGTTNTPIDVHLMVKDLPKYINIYAASNPRTITFHIEATKSKEETLELIKKIKDSDCKVGIALNPKTPIEEIYEYLPYIHTVLVMTVEPGKGGQKLISDTLNKISKLKNYIQQNNLENEIEVDGGINLDTIKDVKDAGADIAVVGSFMINAKDYKYTMNALKNI